MSVANQSRKFVTYNHPLFTSNLFVNTSSFYQLNLMVFPFLSPLYIKGFILEEYKKVSPLIKILFILLSFIYIITKKVTEIKFSVAIYKTS